MGKIRVLSDNLVSKIAAGEIVERPASVVKELVENSIDAGSASIEIELESGGRRLIRVSDDGEGMTRDEALLCLERHATSKIKDVKDLFSLTSLGFRGEAIPSIASVSRFRMITKTHSDMIGTMLKVDGGVLRGVEEAGSPPGTDIEVKDLFFNTPPRLKFMKRPETELSNVVDIVEREAIPRPGVSFELRSDGRVLLRFPARDSVRERIESVYPGTRLFSVEGGEEGVRLTGFFGSPLEGRSTARKLYTYVNGRAVRDRFLTRAVLGAYGKMLEKGRFPEGVLFVELPPGDVDVNVHPTKNEVRFKNPGLVAGLISSCIGRMLGNAPWLASYGRAAGPGHDWRGLTRERTSSYSPPGGGFSGAHASAPEGSDYARGVSREAAPRETHGDVHPGAVREATAPAGELFSSGGTYSDLKIVGQIGDLYIVCASGDGMVIIDQHAAHERINYEKIKNSYEGQGRAPSQELLMPKVVGLSPYEAELLSGHLAPLSALGLRMEPFGDGSYVVRSIPAVLGNADPETLVRDIVGEISEGDKEESLSGKIDRVIATMACHSSIRASFELGPEEMKALLAELDRAEFPHACPHGRPVARELTFGDIERMFKRT
ncbi:MAG TPA: DNA mismatch repair endonuclease MutL [Thermodesulfobacteriota bacterium]|nr:DNA mismatch repair endonuclease MutL [Thermodesulfobacteriota bacterium]